MMTSRLSRCHQTPGLVAAKEFLFQRARCVSYGGRVKLHPPVRKRWYADSPAPKVRKNRREFHPLKSSAFHGALLQQ
jgi:hypothetical protein